MKRARRFVFLAGVLGLIFGVGGTAFATPDNISQQIRGQGSFTTYHLMQSMDKAYNTADGCRQFVTAGTQRLDEVCVANGPPYVNNTATGATENWDHDVAFSDYGIGSGNGRTLLSNFGNPGYPRIDFARSSSLATIAGFRFVAYAQDMLAYTAFVGNIDSSCNVDRSAGAVFDDNGPLASTNGPGTAHPTFGTWPIPPGGTCAAATPWGSVGGGTVVGGAIYPMITKAQLKQIYQCSTPAITDFNQLNASIPAGTAIVPWAVQDGSGTRRDFDGKLGSGCDSTAPIPSAFKDGDSTNGERKILENVATPISGVPDLVHGGRTQTCETVNRPNQQAGHPDCPGVSYTQSIFYFSAGDWFASPVFTTVACSPTLPNPAQCQTTSNTNTGNSLQGSGTILGGLEGVNATRDAMGPSCVAAPNCYPYSRYVYNVYRNATGSNDAPDWVRDYIGELGWICRPDGSHESDPNTGVNYGVEVTKVITDNGFAAMPVQGTFGGPGVNIGGGVTAPGGTKCLVDQ